VDAIQQYLTAHQRDIVELIRKFVECESPSDDSAAVDRFVDLVCDTVASFADIQTYPGGQFGRTLICRMHLTGKGTDGQILALGHSDTVWQLGTLSTMPFREADGRLWGPGVLDMKSGIAFFIFAVRALRELGIGSPSKVVLQLNPDEEVGSEVSRELTEANAKASKAVLVLEPGTGLTGKLKTARKGVGDYTIVVRGQASHAGVDFAAGASAIVELARQINHIASFAEIRRGITVNPGVITGGTRSNVVAAQATAVVDIRVPKLNDAPKLEKKFRSLRPFDSRCSIEVSGGLNRPPMERTPEILRLYHKAESLAREMNVTLEESATGGGSDGNFTAALGVPTLDGLGGVGEGAHARNESILVNRIVDRTALIAKLLSADL
jgi:glutamate carboxypeptidase